MSCHAPSLSLQTFCKSIKAVEESFFWIIKRHHFDSLKRSMKTVLYNLRVRRLKRRGFYLIPYLTCLFAYLWTRENSRYLLMLTHRCWIQSLSFLIPTHLNLAFERGAKKKNVPAHSTEHWNSTKSCLGDIFFWCALLGRWLKQMKCYAFWAGQSWRWQNERAYKTN